MADRDGSARRKKKTKRQTIRVPVDEVPRRMGTGSIAVPVSDDPATEEISETSLTPVPDPIDEADSAEGAGGAGDTLEPEAPAVPSRPSRAAQKTVVDMQLPAGLLEMFGEPEAPPPGEDTAELSVDVDVSDAERPSVPPLALEPLLDVDPGDRPTPPPRQTGAVAPVDPADRPTPLPRAPSPAPPPPFAAVTPRATPAPVAVAPPPFAGVTPRSTPAPIPAAPPPPPPRPAAAGAPASGVVVMAPIRSVGVPIVEAPPPPPPEDDADPGPPEPLLKPVRHSTQHGVGPAVPPLVDNLEWSGDGASAPLAFDGALPGEPGADGAARQDDEGEEDEEADVGDDTGDAPGDAREDVDDEELAREPTQVRRTRDDGTPSDVAAKSAVVAPPLPPTAPSPRPATPAPMTAGPAPVPLPATGATTPPPPDSVPGLLASPPEPAIREVASEPVREERDSDPGTPIDVEAELLAGPSLAEAPPPPTRTPSGPKMQAVAPPLPPVAAPPTPPSSPSVSLLGGPVVSVPPPVPVDARPETGERRKKAKKWWEDFFNEDWLRTIPPVPEETTRKECDFIESSLGVERGASILDLGCGTGRHAVELATRGYSVVALDLSLTMLEHAQSAAEGRGCKVTFQQADIRDLSFESSFDAVYCIGTTLGLFDEEGNLQVIRNAHRALRENGTLLIEVVNRDHVLSGQPNLVWFEGDGCVCMEETNVNYITSRLQVKRTVMPDEGGQTETEYSIRLYSLHELGSLLHKNGFRVVEVSGHWATRGVYFGAHSQRIVVLAEKRAAGEPVIPTGTQPGQGGKAET